MASADTFDVLVATDCRFPAGSTASVVDEIQAQARAGYRTALLHVPSPLIEQHRSFAPALRELVDDGTATLVTGQADVTAKLLLVRHPSVFTEPRTRLPKISTDQALVVANVLPDGPGKYGPNYDVDQVAQHVEEATGAAPNWVPISPVVRDALAPKAAGRTVLSWDWEPVIDITGWQTERAGFRSDRPVLGRHTADHWTKWPGRRRDILAAYPDDPRYDVRVLGGTATPTAVLGYQPANWTGLPFGAAPPQRFLADLDFFVYFHHRKFTEPFGRAVLEALASGAVAILPPALEPIFGAACRYGQPSDVQQYVDELYADWDAYAAQSRKGVELAAKRFGPETHLERLVGLIGKPASPGPEPAPAARPRGTLVVDLTHGGTLQPVVSSTVRATVAAGEPRIVALPAARAADLTARVAVETFPRALDDLPAADRRQFLRRRIAAIIDTHEPSRMIVVDDSDGAARELFVQIEGLPTHPWLVHEGSSSGALDDEVAAEVAAILPQGWTISPLPSDREAETTHAQVSTTADADINAWQRFQRWAGRLLIGIRQKVLAWVRADSERGEPLESEDTGPVLPVEPSGGQQHGEQLPVALVIVTDQYSDPADGVNAIVERQLVAGTFRTALLAPAEWEPAATAAGLTVETFIPEPAWTLMYGSGWPPYFRRRVLEACQAVAASTVVFAERVAPESTTALDVLEAVRIRPPSHPR